MNGMKAPMMKGTMATPQMNCPECQDAMRKGHGPLMKSRAMVMKGAAKIKKGK